MKLIKRIIEIFFDTASYKSSTITKLQLEKINAFLMMFPF